MVGGRVRRRAAAGRARAGGDFVFFDANGVEFGSHPADSELNPRGGSPVAYFSVARLNAARRELIELGATPLRGPLAVAEDRAICQLRDPFGNVFGLDGPP